MTSTKEVRELDRGTAGRALPVQVRGVVTFLHPQPEGSFIVDDGKAGVYVAATDAVRNGFAAPAKDFKHRLRPGMEVEVTGVSSPGGFAPVIIPHRISLLGDAPLPPAKPVTIPDLQTGRLDCERVRVKGVVQHVEITAGAIDAVRLELAGAGGHFVGYAMNKAGFDPARLVDAEVELSGVALTFFNERAEVVGARVQIVGIDDVALVRAPPGSPFVAPEARLDSLLPFSPDPPSLHRRRIRGIVTVSRPGMYFYLQDGERAVRVSTRDPSLLAPGDRVEVSGFVELWQYFAEVREGVFRKLGSGPVPKAEPVTRAEVLASRPWIASPQGSRHVDGRRVALKGRIEKVETSEEEGRRISLDCDGYAIFATIVNEGPQDGIARLVPGSEVQVMGACQVQLSVGRPTVRNPVPTGFQLLVHSPEDVAVLRVPPWWTPRRLGLALGATAAVLAMALAWAWLLRKRVALRSTQLAAEMSARRHAAVEFDATLRERKRLAADLHDTLEQALMGLALQLEAVELFRGENPERSSHHLHLARQFLDRSREDVRRSVWNLRAQGLEGRTLYEALCEMVSGITAGQPVEMYCEMEGEPVALPDFIAGNLLLLAQEAVTNARKHAKARKITVRVVFDREDVKLRVSDDGRGFDPAQAPGLKEGHFGLQGMRERVKRLGGSLEIVSEPGQGSEVNAHVPADRASR